jgi:hypothetical protein
MKGDCLPLFFLSKGEYSGSFLTGKKMNLMEPQKNGITGGNRMDSAPCEDGRAGP